MSTWKPDEWVSMTRSERKQYREAHAAEIAAAKKIQRNVFRQVLAKAILSAAEFGDSLTGDEKFETATETALRGLDALLAFDQLRGELALLGVSAEKVNAHARRLGRGILYRSPFRAWVEGEIQSLYELGFDELKKVAGEA